MRPSLAEQNLRAWCGVSELALYGMMLSICYLMEMALLGAGEDTDGGKSDAGLS